MHGQASEEGTMHAGHALAASSGWSQGIPLQAACRCKNSLSHQPAREPRPSRAWWRLHSALVYLRPGQGKRP